LVPWMRTRTSGPIWRKPARIERFSADARRADA
jgi:hypothetical protein